MKAPGWARTGAAVALLLGVAACGGTGSNPVPTAGGDELLIVTPTPGTPAAPGDQPAVETYVVREGDTLSGIAARFGVPEEELQRANDLADPNRLVVGQRLDIPAVEP